MRTRTPEEYEKGILAGDRVLLSQAITLVESTRADHRELAEDVLSRLVGRTPESIRVGITGVPGVGKSTFIESLGLHVIRKAGRRLAVLAIDPSSSRSGGSILGDKTRMNDLAREEAAYVRPSPARGSLGGVARKTRESIVLCEAAGFDTIFVETVGVGQSETAVHSMVDFFLLLMLSGAGDELQGIKRGIMEMADALVITKADGSNQKPADRARAQYAQAMHLFPPAAHGRAPVALTCSALENRGITEVWSAVQEHIEHTRESGYFARNRREQTRHWLYESILELLKERFFENDRVKARLPEIEKDVLEGTLSSHAAARQLLEYQ